MSTVSPLTARSSHVALSVLAGHVQAALDSGDLDTAQNFAAAHPPSARRCCELAPDDPRAWSDLGRVYALEGKYAEAAECFAEAVQIDPRFADGWHNFGTALKSLKDREGAFKALKNALLLDPARAETYLNLGNLLSETGQLEDAVEFLPVGLRRYAVPQRPSDPLPARRARQCVVDLGGEFQRRPALRHRLRRPRILHYAVPVTDGALARTPATQDFGCAVRNHRGRSTRPSTPHHRFSGRAVGRPVQTPSRWQVRQPIYTRSIERWRAYAPFLQELDRASQALVSE